MKEITDNIVYTGDTIAIKKTKLTASRLKQMIDDYDGEDEDVLQKVSETENVPMVTLYNALILYEDADKTRQSNIFEFGESRNQ